MSVDNALTALVPIVGKVLIEKTKKDLQELSDDASDPTKKLVFALTVNAIDQLGPEGIEVAKQAVEDLLAGKAPDINWANPRLSSDAVALLQNAEGLKKKKAQAALQKVGDVLGQLTIILIKALLSGALNYQQGDYYVN